MDKVKDYVSTMVLDNPFIFLKDIRCAVVQYLSVHVSISYICKILKKLGYTRKKPQKIPFTQKVEAQRIEWAKKSLPPRPRNVVCIDEIAFFAHQTSEKGYAQRGQRLRSPSVTGNRSHVSVAAATCNGKLLSYTVSAKPFDTDKCVEFIANLPLEAHHTHILMDNVRFHHSYLVQECIALRGQTPMYIPPYSPEFNPIENMFSHVKRIYKASLITNNTARIEHAFQSVTRAWLSAAYRHSWNTFKLYRRMSEPVAAERRRGRAPARQNAVEAERRRGNAEA
jgi:hypothetical protein